ncbi:hypothetical protein LTR36_003519 [Oleoguttula mirabilis]|uniref:Signal recognition particle protein n=1 Tax=Oleoguttula mirabilis TaxID=1507867 RepID=A0AAV9JIU8_9PEZI|nr:hypothetical protein LTR36_003519 [Oleoguttula mirabilis]
MSNPRIEEVSDDDDIGDPEEMDLDAFDFAKPQAGGLAPAMAPAGSQMTPEAIQAMLQPQGQGPSGASTGAQWNRPQQPTSEKERMQREREQHERSKNFQCIYPVYFDSTRSREEGRRVRKEDAVPNPLAREIVDALTHIGNEYRIPLQIVFEPHKGHPKDWANPGRVRVLVKKDGQAVSAKIQNKHHLYKLIAEYLKTHPTTEESPMKFRFQGMPVPKEKLPLPAVPRGFKIGSILPLHSPALSGGGVSENFMQDMMAEMGGQMPGGMALPPGMAGMMGGAGGGAGGGGQPQKKVKDKKKK